MTVAAEQGGGRDRRLARLTASALEGFPADQLAAPQLVDAGVTRDAEQPGLDLQRDGRASVPGALSLFPGRQGQVVGVVWIAHQALDLTEDRGVVRCERVLDSDRVAADLGLEHGLGSAHSPTIGGLDYSRFKLGLRNNYEVTPELHPRSCIAQLTSFLAVLRGKPSARVFLAVASCGLLPRTT